MDFETVSGDHQGDDQPCGMQTKSGPKNLRLRVKVLLS